MLGQNVLNILIINQRFKYKKKRTTSAPKLRLRRRGQSYGFHVWIPYEKRYYKRSLATTDRNEALKKLTDIERVFWQETDRKKS